ncbi:OspG family effector kinase [Methylobacillus glycogenes]|uniref:OspG family effector kinase n=1 Tax=Methylobacillus glycogenes TaxID=406 RepID=UPI000470DAAC|nr:ADP-ribosyltransferase [Methylobacillus glycogenes]
MPQQSGSNAALPEGGSDIPPPLPSRRPAPQQADSHPDPTGDRAGNLNPETNEAAIINRGNDPDAEAQKQRAERLKENYGVAEQYLPGPAGLTDAETMGVGLYTNGVYIPLNKALRSGETLVGGLADIDQAMQDALPRLSDGRVIKTFRGGRLPPGLEGTEGSVFKDEAYLSTSRDYKASKDFAGKSYSKEYIIFGKSGADVSNISIESNEREVLYNRGTEFDILLTAPDNKRIVMEEKNLPWGTGHKDKQDLAGIPAPDKPQDSNAPISGKPKAKEFEDIFIPKSVIPEPEDISLEKSDQRQSEPQNVEPPKPKQANSQKKDGEDAAPPIKIDAPETSSQELNNFTEPPQSITDKLGSLASPISPIVGEGKDSKEPGGENRQLVPPPPLPLTADYLSQFDSPPSSPDESARLKFVCTPKVVESTHHEEENKILPRFDIDNEIKNQLGDEIGRGAYGVVYQDKTDPDFVIKKFIGKDPSVDYIAQDEAERFAKYYGDDSVEIIKTKDAVYLKMYKVPGLPMRAIKSYPEGASDAFHRMMMKMENANIPHVDLHAGNFMFSEQLGEFFPIDLGKAGYTDSEIAQLPTFKSTANNYDHLVDRISGQRVGMSDWEVLDLVYSLAGSTEAQALTPVEIYVLGKLFPPRNQNEAYDGDFLNNVIVEGKDADEFYNRVIPNFDVESLTLKDLDSLAKQWHEHYNFKHPGEIQFNPDPSQ